MLDDAGLDRNTLRVPQTVRELGFVAALEKILKQEGPAAWPIVVLCAPDPSQPAGDVPTLATTRRIMLRDPSATLQPAAAIVLNSGYWGPVDPPPAWGDAGLATVVARHEIYHARRAWLRAAEVIAHADAIEERMREAGAPRVGRQELESMVQRGLAAREEVEAIDGSIGSAVLLAAHRRGILQYREENRLCEERVMRALMGLFPAVTRRWLTDLLHSELRKHPVPDTITSHNPIQRY